MGSTPTSCGGWPSRAPTNWAADITYIPLEGGGGYLAAIMDWCSRAVLSWELSNTMTVEFCVNALQTALRRYGIPEIEGLWRSLKYEDVYLHAYTTLAEARIGIDRWFHFYNDRRPHQALENFTPMQVYRRLRSAA